MRTQRGGAGGVQGCMACAGDACKSAACQTRGALGRKLGESLCTGPRRTSNAAWGLLLSTIGRRPQVNDRYGLVGIKIDEHDVKKARADRQNPTSP